MEEKKWSKKKIIIIISFIVLLICIDQISKLLITNYISESQEIELIPKMLKLTYVKNTGIAFGIIDNTVGGIVLVNLIILGIIVKFIVSQKDRIDKKTSTILFIIIAGGVSNLIDRIARGFVVDYIDIGNIINFPVFNIADMYVVIGWVLLALFLAIHTTKEIRELKQINKLSKQKNS